jgi:hypothetical protein
MAVDPLPSSVRNSVEFAHDHDHLTHAGLTFPVAIASASALDDLADPLNSGSDFGSGMARKLLNPQRPPTD